MYVHTRERDSRPGFDGVKIKLLLILIPVPFIIIWFNLMCENNMLTNIFTYNSVLIHANIGRMLNLHNCVPMPWRSKDNFSGS